MSRPSPMLGLYIGLQSFIAAAGLQAKERDSSPVLVQHLAAASRAVETETRRYFFPYSATAFYRWPQYAPQATWTLWTEEDLLAVTSVEVAASGIGAVPIPLVHYFLEPQWAGPPYSRIEIDLSSGDAFQSGQTPQRSISIAGQWGYTNATLAVGTLAGAVSSSSTTLLSVSEPDLIDTGDVLAIDDESLSVSSGGANPLTVRRGVNGTTAVTHLDGAAVAKYQAPAEIVDLVIARALKHYQRSQAVWARPTAAAQMPSELQQPSAMPASQQNAIIEHYRRERSFAV